MRSWGGAVVGTLLLTMSLLTSPSMAQTVDIEELIAALEVISQESSTHNELVKEAEREIESRQASIMVISEQQAQYRFLADEAAATAARQREEITRLAQAKYRGMVRDPISVALNGDSPQNVIDRVSYLSGLATTTSELMDGLDAATREAADHLGAANRKKAEADFHLGGLDLRLTQLEDAQEKLLLRQEEMKASVEALSREQMTQWVGKNSPLEIDISTLLEDSGMASSVVEAALTKIGSPYSWGAVGPTAFDCSGLIYWAFQQQGMTVPRTSQAQMAGGMPVEADQLQAGDIIGYHPGATHVGLYIGQGMIVHASDYGIPVQVVSVDSAPIYGARRY